MYTYLLLYSEVYNVNVLFVRIFITASFYKFGHEFNLYIDTNMTCFTFFHIIACFNCANTKNACSVVFLNENLCIGKITRHITQIIVILYN